MGYFSSNHFASNHFRSNHWAPEEEAVQPPVEQPQPTPNPPAPMGGGGDGVVSVVFGKKPDKTASVRPRAARAAVWLRARADALEEVLGLDVAVPEPLETKVEDIAPAPAETRQEVVQTPEPPAPAHTTLDVFPRSARLLARFSAGADALAPQDVLVSARLGVGLAAHARAIAVPAETVDGRVKYAAMLGFYANAVAKSTMEFAVAGSDMFSAAGDDDFGQTEEDDFDLED